MDFSKHTLFQTSSITSCPKKWVNDHLLDVSGKTYRCAFCKDTLPLNSNVHNHYVKCKEYYREHDRLMKYIVGNVDRRERPWNKVLDVCNYLVGIYRDVKKKSRVPQRMQETECKIDKMVIYESEYPWGETDPWGETEDFECFEGFLFLTRQTTKKVTPKHGIYCEKTKKNYCSKCDKWIGNRIFERYHIIPYETVTTTHDKLPRPLLFHRYPENEINECFEMAEQDINVALKDDYLHAHHIVKCNYCVQFKPYELMGKFRGAWICENCEEWQRHMKLKRKHHMKKPKPKFVKRKRHMKKPKAKKRNVKMIRKRKRVSPPVSPLDLEMYVPTTYHPLHIPLPNDPLSRYDMISSSLSVEDWDTAIDRYFS